jgi:hypothetical protein
LQLFEFDPDAELKVWLWNENNAMIRASHMFNYWDWLLNQDHELG